MVIHNTERSRFELAVDGEIAELVYRLHPGSISFHHTFVPPNVRQRGLAAQLTEAGLKYAREQGLKVVPLCSYVAAYIKRHPEHQDLVEMSDRY